jgi:pimeloyl-ACP methyl ester carboxylesterase
MKKIGGRLLTIIRFLALSALGTLGFAAFVALRHMIETPQPLESILPGEARLYHWKHGHIFYKVLGATDAPPIVLLHAPSIGASAYEMRKIIGALAQQYRVYAPDLLGFGLSDRPQMDYTAETYVTLCHDFLSSVVGQPATLLASGLSCNYAVMVAHRFPELCQRLLLISPIELFGGERKQDVLTELAQLPAAGSLFYSLISTRAALRYSMARQHLLSRDILSSDVDYLYASTHQFGGQHAPLALLAGKLTLDASEEFEHVQQPTLIIWGAHALNKARTLMSQYHVSPKAQIVLIQDAGRYVHEEAPAMVIANIREWSDEGTTETAEAALPGEPAIVTPEAVSEPPAPSTTTVATAEQPGQVVSEAAPEPTNRQAVEAYCVKCKTKREMQDIQQVTMKNGRPALQGTCLVCGTKLHRIGRQ